FEAGTDKASWRVFSEQGTTDRNEDTATKQFTELFTPRAMDSSRGSGGRSSHTDARRTPPDSLGRSLCCAWNTQPRGLNGGSSSRAREQTLPPFAAAGSGSEDWPLNLAQHSAPRSGQPRASSCNTP